MSRRIKPAFEGDAGFEAHKAIQVADGPSDNGEREPTDLERGDMTPPGKVVDLSAQLAPWVCSGVMGELSAMRQGVTTVFAPELADAAARIAVGMTDSGEFIDQLYKAHVDPVDGGGMDLRFFIGDNLPGPAQLVMTLQRYSAWPSIIDAPCHARIGVGFSMSETGKYAVVVAARRNVIPRQRKAS